MITRADLVAVSFNSSKHLPHFLHFIKSKTSYPYHLIMIDNHSSDISPKYLREVNKRDSIGKKMTLILNSSNIGLAKAWNVGLKHCKGEYVVFLNPDVKLTDCWLDKLILCAKRYPNAGVVGAKILTKDNIIANAGWTGHKERGRGLPNKPGIYNKEGPVDAVLGCCFLIKRSILPKVGNFDERFFLYWEELDFCRRVRKAGFSVMYCPVPIFHYDNGSKITQKERNKLFLNSKEKYMRKWGLSKL
jgi:GT2 family glycosyltransferase